jgi:hypothetical protein
MVRTDRSTSALKHFEGSQECNILQSDIYLAPHSSNLKLSPFCNNRASLLEALSNGGRHGFDEPYVGKGMCHSISPRPQNTVEQSRLYLSLVLNS